MLGSVRQSSGRGGRGGVGSDGAVARLTMLPGLRLVLKTLHAEYFMSLTLLGPIGPEHRRPLGPIGPGASLRLLCLLF